MLIEINSQAILTLSYHYHMLIENNSWAILTLSYHYHMLIENNSWAILTSFFCCSVEAFKLHEIY